MPATPERLATIWRSIPLWAAVLIATLVIGVAGALVHRGGLIGDDALIELQTRQVLSRDFPLTGPYSRFGWAHPGPAMFFLMAPIYFLLGSSGTALMVAAAAVNAVAATAAVWIAERHDRRLALGVALLIAAMLMLSDVALITDPWGPRIVVIPSILLIVSLAFASTGDDRAAGTSLVAAAFVMSTHVGFGAALIPATIVGMSMWWWTKRTRPPRWSLITAMALVVPILVDTAFRWPGNASRVIKFAATDDGDRLGLASAVRFAARASSPEFLQRDRYAGFVGFVSSDQPFGMLPGALLIALGALAVAASTPLSRWAARLLLAVAVGAVWSVANTQGELFEYLLVILPVFATVGWALVIGEIVHRTVRRDGRSTQHIEAVLSLALLMATIGTAITETTRTHRDPEAWSIVQEATTEARNVAAGGAVLLVADVGDPFELIGYFGGVMNELDRVGVDVRVLPGTAEVVGDRRTGDPATMPTLTLSVVDSLEQVVDRGDVIYTSGDVNSDGARVRLHFRRARSDQ